MRLFTIVAALLLGLAASAAAQADRPVLYIPPTTDHMETYIAAAILKKAVPVVVTTEEADAAYTLHVSDVDIQKESTGSKVTRCLFAYCAGIEDKASTTVELTKAHAVLWSYSVNKGRGQKNRQALAEAIAKHLKDEGLAKLRAQ
jgi:hypothetical protein